MTDVELRAKYNETIANMKAIKKEWIKAQRFDDDLTVEDYNEFRNDYELEAKASMSYRGEMETRRQAAITTLMNSNDPEVRAAIQTLKLFNI